MLDKRIIYTKCMYNCLYHVSSFGEKSCDYSFFRGETRCQEGLVIVIFLNKLIVSCKEAVRIPIFLGYF